MVKHVIKCPFANCDRKNATQYKMKQHDWSHTLSFQCNQCQRRFSTAYSLNKQVCKPNNLEEEATSAQPVLKPCEITIDGIQKKGYECPFDCGFQNKFYSDVGNHMKNSHKEEISLAFQCNLCKINVISAFALLNHKCKTK